METKMIVKLAGITISAIALGFLVIQHPVLVLTIALGAAVYFIGELFIK